MSTRERWSKILLLLGYIAMLVGALDPMEGSLAILPGSALVALGTFIGQGERALIAYRLGVFVLIAFGVGALFGLSALGGFGGKAGLSMWWGMLVLPYLIGLPMGILGPGNPRWVQRAGILLGLWYLAIAVMIVRTLLKPNPSRPFFPEVLITVCALGLVIVGGCIWRLRRRTARPA